jgi:hypothetical protein
MIMQNPITALMNAQGANVQSPMTAQELPPALASILSIGTQTVPQSNMNPQEGMTSGMQGPQTFVPQYEAGGMIGAGGMPEPTSVGVTPQVTGQGEGMTPQMIDMQVNQFMNQNPQQVQQIVQAIMQAMQTGEITMEELNQAEQYAKLAVQNPEMYPYIRNFLIQQGIATEDVLSPQYDSGLIFTVLLAVKAVKKGGAQAAGAPQAGVQPTANMPSMADGGPIPKSKSVDGGVLIKAHEGEYVIPAHVVKMKGREFFDSMLDKYKDS